MIHIVQSYLHPARYINVCMRRTDHDQVTITVGFPYMIETIRELIEWRNCTTKNMLNAGDKYLRVCECVK